MQKCNTCFRKSSKQEHQCIVCNNFYETVELTAKHQRDRGHIGGHHPDGGPLTRTRATTRNGRTVKYIDSKRDGANEEEEQLGLNEDDEEIVNADAGYVSSEPPTMKGAKRRNDSIARGW